MRERDADHDFLLAALERYERPLVGYVLGITGDLETSRDVVQDVFIKLSQHLSSLDRARIAPWLFTAARNRAIDYHRKHQRLVPMSLELLEREPAATSLPSDDLEEKELTQQITRWIGKLPPKQREAVRLKFESGLSYQQISEVLETTASNVGTLIHLGIKALREQWQAVNAWPARPEILNSKV